MKQRRRSAEKNLGTEIAIYAASFVIAAVVAYLIWALIFWDGKF